MAHQPDSSVSIRTISGRWSPERATQWSDSRPWLVGCNFIPSTASNQLEMWQPDTFDLETIQRELGYAAALGFNTVRVYLHDLLWRSDSPGLTTRIDAFLESAADLGIGTMLVLLDACWGNRPHLGPQAPPIPGIHNSRWVMSPGSKQLWIRDHWPAIEDYVKSVLQRFGSDDRVVLWDLYNEPGNEGLLDSSLPLLEAVFTWARSVDPQQPLTVGRWETDPGLDHLNEFQELNSDIITFHSYYDLAAVESLVDRLRGYERPIICTEYMARTLASRFESHLPFFKAQGIGAISWGLVAGKTQTIFPWESTYGAEEPDTWFHDILRPDGTPFDEEEILFIRSLTQAPNRPPRPHHGSR